MNSLGPSKEEGTLLAVTWTFGSKVGGDSIARTKGSGIAHLTTKAGLSREQGWSETQAKARCK